MLKRILLLLLIFGAAYNTDAQQFRDYVRAGDRAYEQQNYYEALTRYGDAMEMDDRSMEVIFRYAQAARKFDAFTLAEKLYEKVVRSEESEQFPEAYYGLAAIKQQLGKYEEATNLYSKFLATNPTDTDLTLSARQGIKNCEWAKKAIEKSTGTFVVKQLSPEINTPYSDFGAVERGDTLYYTSDRFENESDEMRPKRHISKVLNSVKMTKGLPLRGGFNKRRSHTAHTAFNTAGDKVFYNVCEYVNMTDIRCQLFVRQKQSGDNWGAAEQLPPFINLPEYTHTQPSIGKDDTGKEYLYFASDRPGGKGGMDLWSVLLNADGTYGQPFNLSELNTPEHDITPFFDTKNQILYFSTRGYPTLGGYDIYKSQKIGNDWQNPQHVEAPINSSFNDLYYSVNEDASKAYFASNRLGSAYIEQDKEACCNDIYSVELAEIRLHLLAMTFDSLDNTALAGTTVVLTDADGQEIDKQYNARENVFTFELQPQQKYRLQATKEGYRGDMLAFETGDGQQAKPIEQKLFLAKLPKEAPKPLTLEAFVFDESRQNLKGATVILIDQSDNNRQKQDNPVNNDFDFALERETPYMLVAQKQGYESDTLLIDPSSLLVASNIQKQLFLKKKAAPPPPPPVTKLTLDGYLPLPLYFDNDQPDSNTRRTTTQKTYVESYNAYYARKHIFQEEYSKGMLGEQKIVAETEIDNFFEVHVHGGRTALDQFSEQLLRYLQQGESAEIMVKGFASPRAKSDYNKALTKRRISSVRNHFQHWRAGALIPFINSRQLKITEVPYGEDSASARVSDNISDRKNSIYSVPASKERRVEIVEVRQ